MSLKENLKLIKEEILEQESFLEGIFKLGIYYKKYKKIILSIIAIVVAYGVFASVRAYYQNQTTIKANEAFNAIVKNYDNKTALEFLKQNNKNLYDIAVFNQAKKDNSIDISFLDKSNVWFIKQLVKYDKAIKNANASEIDALIAQRDFLLKDVAIMNKALIQIKHKKYKKAKNTLEFLSEEASKSEMAIVIKHFLIDK